MDNLFLIYIHKIGSNWSDEILYEFLFSDTIEDIDGEFWDKFPAAGIPEPPREHFVKKVGKLSSEIDFCVVQNSDTFCVWDALDGIVGLGWEDISDYESYPDNRLHFHFGETLEEVNKKLYSRDNALLFKEDDESKSN